MATQSRKLASGAVVTWTMEPIFGVPRGSEALDPAANVVHGVTLGFVKVSSGFLGPIPNNLDDAALRRFPFFSSTHILHNHKAPLECQYRQVGRISSFVHLFAGRKHEDGSIVEHTSNLNQRWILDPSFQEPALLAPWIPYVRNKVKVPPGDGLVVKDMDQPAFGSPLKQTNHKTGKFNYLFNLQQRSQYLTALYIEDSTGSGPPKPIALEGVLWEWIADLDIHWKNGQATRIVGQNGVRLIQRFPDNIQTANGFAEMNVSAASPDKNLVKLLNDGFTIARSGVPGGECENTHHDVHSPDVRIALKDMGQTYHGDFDFFDFRVDGRPVAVAP